MQQKPQISTTIFFRLAESAVHLPKSPQIHSSFFPPTFSNAEAVLKPANGASPPSSKSTRPKTKNKQNKIRRSHAEKKSQTDTPSSFHEDDEEGLSGTPPVAGRRRRRRGEASFHRFPWMLEYLHRTTVLFTSMPR
jgi:hypothetical protein